MHYIWQEDGINEGGLNPQVMSLAEILRPDSALIPANEGEKPRSLLLSFARLLSRARSLSLSLSLYVCLYVSLTLTFSLSLSHARTHARTHARFHTFSLSVSLTLSDYIEKRDDMVCAHAVFAESRKSFCKFSMRDLQHARFCNSHIFA